MTKIYTRDEINSLLNSSDEAVERAIIRLFERQNEDEQRHATTNTHNNRGFASCDARAGTRFARFLLGMDDNNRVRYAKKKLSHPTATRIFGRYCKDGESVIGRARRIALKHSRQLVEVANSKAAKPAQKQQSCTTLADRGFTFDNGPKPGTWAHTARMMAAGDDSGFDWDAWKDEMKERDM